MEFTFDNSHTLTYQWSMPKLYHLLHFTYKKEECAVCTQVCTYHVFCNPSTDLAPVVKTNACKSQVHLKGMLLAMCFTVQAI